MNLRHIYIDRSLAGYNLFLQCKHLPWYKVEGREVVTDEVSYRAVFGGAADPFDVKGEAPHLMPFQTDLVQRALSRQRFAIFADCGLGKCPMGLAWAHAVAQHGKVLVLAPLAVYKQWLREAEKFHGTDLVDLRVGQAWNDGIALLNWENRREDLDMSGVQGIILDECMIAGTPVDTPSGPRTIESIKPGDEVLNAAGVDVVVATKRRSASRIIRVTMDDGFSLVCSENHPFFSIRGIVPASKLKKGDWLHARSEAVRVLREDPQGEEVADKVLRHILLSEMEDASAGVSGEGPLARGGEEARKGPQSVARLGASEGTGRDRSHPGPQPNGGSGGTGEGISHAAGDEPPSIHPGRQRPSTPAPASPALGDARGGMVHGVRGVARQEATRVSDPLQGGHRQPLEDDRHRGGWIQSQFRGGKDSGCQEGRRPSGARVDRVEVLERGDPGFAEYSGGKDSVCLHDIQVAKHPSFSVRGLLVHNSSIIKNADGITNKWLCDLAARIPFRLALSATPAPNDHFEYASHARWLGMASSVKEYASRYFRKDGVRWILRGHAINPFYRNLSTWSTYVYSPRELGYEQTTEMGCEPDYLFHRASIPEGFRGNSGALFASADVGTDRSSVFGELRCMPSPRIRLIEKYAEGKRLIVWTKRNAEEAAIAKRLDGKVAVINGAMPVEERVDLVDAYRAGDIDHIVTKPRVLGFGVNLPECNHMIYSGFTYSFEEFYQAVRRAHRYGRTGRLEVMVPYTDPESPILTSLQRKMDKFHVDVLAMQARFWKNQTLP